MRDPYIVKLEHRIHRLEEAIRIVGEPLTVRRSDGALVWPFPEFDTLSAADRAKTEAVARAEALRREERRAARQIAHLAEAPLETPIDVQDP